MKVRFPVFALLSVFAVSSLAAPAASAISYQGRLNDGGTPATGSYEFRFTLHDAAAAGLQVGPTKTNAPVAVANGDFTTAIDFGAGAFNGEARYLEIAVRPAGSGAAFTTLAPRQSFSPVPYALRALEGSAGPQGPVGATGATGATGPAGPKGDKGDPGTAGTQGPAGSQGLKGDKGDAGASGPQGPAGAQGIQGVAGPIGLTGLQGPKGDKGDTGATGATGPAGPTGLQGPAGAGANLTPGLGLSIVGSVIGLQTNGAPLNSSLVFKGNTLIWDTVAGTPGPTGATGPAGPQGPKGDKGDTGTAGATGPQGAQGPQGLQGLAGAKGDKGDAGAAGPQGPIGLTGPAGQQGPIGLTGPAGPKGDTGVAGATGATGAAGPAGPQGLPGPSGPIGLTGAVGAAGPAGPQGAKGDKGDAGVAGAQGPAGAAGPAGPQGPQGIPGSSDGWSRVGNAGTTDVNFLGTTDNRPVELRVNGSRALRLEPTGTNGAVNVVGGSRTNRIGGGAVGATIGGGGAVDYLAGNEQVGGPNVVESDFGTVDGGLQNRVLTGSVGGAIGGGGFNVVSNASAATIGGGQLNQVQADFGVVAGGAFNALHPGALSSAVGGGVSNIIQTAASGAVIGGGVLNSVGPDAASAVVPGGYLNAANGALSFAAGQRAKANHVGAFVWSDSSTEADFASTAANQFLIRAGGGVAIGTNNPAGAALRVAGTVRAAQFVGDGSLLTGISGGAAGWSRTGNAGTGAADFLGTIDQQPLEFRVNNHRGLRLEYGVHDFGFKQSVGVNVISGYEGNTIAPGTAGVTVSGGGIFEDDPNPNSASADFATVSGGIGNAASGFGGTVGGGGGNRAAQEGATVSGGMGNRAAGFSATVPGGYSNEAGDYAFASGTQAKATHSGAFVWADHSAFTDFVSTADNQFLIRATGGVAIGTNDPGGVALRVIGTIKADFFEGVAGGVQGPPGPQGPQGPAGPAGAVGATGTQGPAGAAGPAGPQGIPGPPGPGSGSGGWALTGNLNTTPANNYLGTADNQPLELKVNGTRGLRLEPTPTNGAVNVVGGSRTNRVEGGAIGATIGGGGAVEYSQFIDEVQQQLGGPNVVGADFGTVGGGLQNRVETGALGGGIASGAFNSVSNSAVGFIGGGFQNRIENAPNAFIGGGDNNMIVPPFSEDEDAVIRPEGAVIPGGRGNRVNGRYGFAAGRNATAAHDNTFVWSDGTTEGNFTSSGPNQFLIQASGGVGIGTSFIEPGVALQVGGSIRALSYDSYVGQPIDFSINGLRALRLQDAFGPPDGAPALIGGHHENAIAGGAHGAVIAGGGQPGAPNSIGSNLAGAAIGGGMGNAITDGGYVSVIDGGSFNRIRGTSDNGAIGGGRNNTLSNALGGVIGGGRTNLVTANNATIGGGIVNTVSGPSATIGGGAQNEAAGDYNTIGGGIQNVAGLQGATVGGGIRNIAQGQSAVVSGGQQNQATGSFATVPGGVNNLAFASFSYAAGRGAKAQHVGSFVWADSPDPVFTQDFASTADNQFLVRATGGVGINTTEPGGVFGVQVPNGSRVSIANGDYTPELIMSGGPAPGVLRVRRAIELWPNLGGTDPGVMDLRNEAGSATIVLNGGTGSVGIGNPSPLDALHVQSVTGLRVRVQTTGNTYAGLLTKNSVSEWFAGVGQGADAGDWNLYENIGILSHTRLMVQAGGNVGIGTAAPAAKVHIRSADEVRVRAESTGSNPATFVSKNPAAEWQAGIGGSAGYWTVLSAAAGVPGISMTPGAVPRVGIGMHPLPLAETLQVGGTLSTDSHAYINGNLYALAVNPSSDRNLKENFAPVNPREVLEKVTALPVSRWNYKADTAAKHIGPMAQDFRAAFGLGTDDKHIATVDADGVALAAIQGLNGKVESEVAELRAENTDLKQRLERLEQLVNQLTGGGR